MWALDDGHQSVRHMSIYCTRRRIVAYCKVIMVWILSLLIIVMLALEFRQHAALQRAMREQEAMLTSLIALNMDTGRDAKRLVLEYLKYLDDTLLDRGLRRFHATAVSEQRFRVPS
jgi:hypothetical protein